MPFDFTNSNFNNDFNNAFDDWIEDLDSPQKNQSSVHNHSATKTLSTLAPNQSEIRMKNSFDQAHQLAQTKKTYDLFPNVPTREPGKPMTQIEGWEKLMNAKTPDAKAKVIQEMRREAQRQQNNQHATQTTPAQSQTQKNEKQRPTHTTQSHLFFNRSNPTNPTTKQNPKPGLQETAAKLRAQKQNAAFVNSQYQRKMALLQQKQVDIWRSKNLFGRKGYR